MQPPLSTRVPVVLDELLRLLGESTGLDDVGVIDGSFGEIANDMLYVGPGSEDDPGVTVRYQQQPGLGNAYVEEIEVVLSLSSYGGDIEIKPRRDRVTTMLAALQAVVREHQVHDGFWDDALFGPDSVWTQVQSTNGATCAVGLTVLFRSVI